MLRRLVPRTRSAQTALLVIAGGLLIAFVASFARFAADVDALRQRRAIGPSWVFPSRMYSDGLTFVPGRALPPDYLQAHLRARGYQESIPPRRPGTYAWTRNGVEIVLRGFEEADDPGGSGGPERVRLRLQEGRLADVERLGGIAGRHRPDTRHAPRLEPVLVSILFDEHRVRRTWVPLARIPKPVRDAVIAAEDRRFYRHLGLDLRGNFRALVTNVQAGGVREGGSTITQQLARGLFLGRERTLGRKLAEIPLAIGLELLLSKDQILEMYLNSVYWGQGGGCGIAGVQEASRWYFDRPIETLRTVEAATLAGMIPAPNTISPFRNPKLARSRRNRVLDDMVANRTLSPEAAGRAKAMALNVRRGDPPVERFPSFTGYVRDVLGDRVAKGAAEHWGMTIFTTLDVVWQTQAEAWLTWGVDDLERWGGRAPAPLQGAFVAEDPATGAIRAVVGGRGYQPGDFNRATQAHRQPGSAIKPVVYAAALEGTHRGRRFSPASTLPDVRREFTIGDTVWKPRNDEGEYHETVTLAKALAKSLNVATANLVEAIGPQEIVRAAERFGLGKLKPVMSIGLGTNEVTLLSLTDAYSAFPNGGVRHDPYPIRAVVDARGQTIYEPDGHTRRVLRAETAALMTGLLEDVVIYGVAYPLRAEYGFTRPVGGKTGTTNDYNDAWFVGFTPDLVAGVWVGYDTPRSLQRPAARTALPVWAGIVQQLLDGFPATPFPGDQGLELAWIDPWTGGLAASGCPVMRVPFLPGTAPTRYCDVDHYWAPWPGDSTEQAVPEEPGLEPEPEAPDTIGASIRSAPPRASFPRPPGSPRTPRPRPASDPTLGGGHRTRGEPGRDAAQRVETLPTSCSSVPSLGGRRCEPPLRR